MKEKLEITQSCMQMLWLIIQQCCRIQNNITVIVEFLYTNNEQFTKATKTIMFKIVSKSVILEMNDIYKTLMDKLKKKQSGKTSWILLYVYEMSPMGSCCQLMCYFGSW
jgi:hypothetical protein